MNIVSFICLITFVKYILHIITHKSLCCQLGAYGGKVPKVFGEMPVYHRSHTGQFSLD